MQACLICIVSSTQAYMSAQSVMSWSPASRVTDHHLLPSPFFRSSLQVLGATTLMLYAVHLMVHVRKFEPPFVRKPFSVRVVVPCYKEDIETLEETVECAIKAAKIAMDRGQANAGD